MQPKGILYGDANDIDYPSCYAVSETYTENIPHDGTMITFVSLDSENYRCLTQVVFHFYRGVHFRDKWMSTTWNSWRHISYIGG